MAWPIGAMFAIGWCCVDGLCVLFGWCWTNLEVALAWAKQFILWFIDKGLMLRRLHGRPSGKARLIVG